MIGEKRGKYTILGTLGTGSMGTVYKAEDPAGRTVALKLIRSQVLYDVERRERFLQDILAASLARHDGLCPILEIGDDNDDFFVVMPYLEGKTLEQFCEHKPLPWRHALDIAIAVGDALSAAHAVGAVHRGLKPSNIWLQKEGAVVVSDCSMARFTEMARHTHARTAGAQVGFTDTLVPLAALAYMSPEQVRGDAIDPRTDVFSLGAILYEMLTGRHPLDARNTLSRMSAILEAKPPPLAAKLGSIPPELNEIMNRALAMAASDRFGSMQQFVSALKAARRTAPAQSQLSQGRRRSRGFRITGWLVAVTLIAALIVSFFYFLRRA